MISAISCEGKSVSEAGAWRARVADFICMGVLWIVARVGRSSSWRCTRGSATYMSQ